VAQSTVKITGADAMRKKLAALGRNWQNAVQKAVHQELTIIQDDAINRTPKDEGVLRGSYDLTVFKKVRSIVGRILVGGPAQAYALYVHEHGPRAGGPGEAFFLKNAIDAVRHTISARLGARIKQNHGLR